MILFLPHHDYLNETAGYICVPGVRCTERPGEVVLASQAWSEKAAKLCCYSAFYKYFAKLVDIRKAKSVRR